MQCYLVPFTTVLIHWLNLCSRATIQRIPVYCILVDSFSIPWCILLGRIFHLYKKGKVIKDPQRNTQTTFRCVCYLAKISPKQRTCG